MKQPSCKTAQPQEASSRGQLCSHSSPKLLSHLCLHLSCLVSCRLPGHIPHSRQAQGRSPITSPFGEDLRDLSAGQELGPQGRLRAQHLDRDTSKASGLLRSMFLELFIL